MTFENERRKPRRHEPETPSSHLWVGNLGPEVTESELSDLFSKYGPIDGITCYASRTYAFVYFKRVEDASAAKDALQGFPLSSGPNTTTNNLKIEFAKPAKPSKHVWVGGFSSSVTKEKLEEELTKFGKIEDFKFNRDRNTALVDFVRVEDASAAVKSLSGVEIEGDRIRVDFLRSHPSRREQSDFHEFGSAQFRGMGGPDSSWSHPDFMRNHPEPPYPGNKRMQPPQPLGSRKAGQQPSKVLWVGYPPSVVVDEEMLHNAMILHGEIERIKCFSGRNYSFVEFRSVEEARRAKDALQGRLFDDPRINIMFSNSELAPGKDFGPPFSSMRGQGPDMFSNDVPFRPPHMDMFSSNRALAPNNFSAGLLGPGIPRPFGPRGSSDPLLPTPDFSDSSMSDLPAPLGLNKRKLSPPLTGLLTTPSNSRPLKSSGWDVLDPSQLPRESKRSRIDGLASFNEPTGRDEFGDTPYLAGPPHLGGPVHADDDFIWRGVIAKGGTPVCRARCIPIENGLECELPSVVNCSARTGLDMLAKHCAGADGFDIVFFLPDSEDDFANYTEFLRYLGSKDRAGVAKLDDGTTLFLVPPSDFLSNVLKVACRERLYGVVLRLPQQLPAGPAASQQTPQPIPPTQYMDMQLPRSHEYATPINEVAAQADYSRAADGTTMPPRVPYSAIPVSKEQTNDSAPTSQPGVSLTPELIATLTKLLPANAQPSLAQNTQPQLGHSTTGPPPMPVLMNDRGPLSHGWNQPPHLPDQMGHFSQQFGSQVYGNPQVPTNFQPYAPNLNQTSQPIPVIPEVMQTQNSPYNNQDQGSVPSRPPIIHPVATQSQQYMPSTQGVQPYTFEIPNNTSKEHTGAHGAPAGHYSGVDSQQQSIPALYANQMHVASPQNNLPSAVGNVNVEQINQAQRFQPVPSGVNQSTAEVEVDKNQRYQSTLQFAANLLMQIQQQQQQKQ